MKTNDITMTNFETLKGTTDFEPQDMIKINNVLKIITKNFEKYGFRPFDTPLIEYFNTLSNKYEKDSEIIQEIFKVSDRGNRELGLRYDLTVPLCRYIASKKQLKLPFKRYQIGKVFRDGPIKIGRTREFIQCDADIIGLNNIESEAETLKMFYDTYSELKIKSILELNNNKILRGALLQEGFKENELNSLVLSIDKLKKIGEKEVLEEINKKQLDFNKAKKSLEILNSNNFEEIKKLAKNEILIEGIEELENLTILLKELKVKFRINFSMSRGLAIYTGNIWEVYDTINKVSSSIGSGGRYDKAIGNYIGDGRDFPAFGISFGLVPILACLDEQKSISQTNLLIAPLDENLIKKTFEIAEKLRKNNNVEICYDYKLKKAFDYATYIGAEKIVIFGKKDLENKQYTIKNLETKEEEKIDF